MTPPNFSVYEKVWIMENNTPTKKIVFAIVESMDYFKVGTKIHYQLVNSRVGGASWGNYEGIRRSRTEHTMFPTKEALLGSLL